MRPPLTLCCALSCLASAAACGSDSRDVVVGTDVETVSATPVCIDRAATDTVVAVSAEGDVWLADGSGATKVARADGSESALALDLDSASAANATSDSVITFIEDSFLWRRDDVSRENISLPESLGSPRAFCGDPETDRDTFLVTDTGLYERASGLWWSWRPQAETSFGTIEQLARFDGACTTDDETLWLRNAAGELWRVSEDDARVVLGGAEDPVTGVLAVRDDLIVASLGEALRTGPDFGALSFEAGAVTTIAAAGGVLWSLAGGQIYFESDGTWRRLDPGALTVTAIHPHAAGGAWIETADSLCHVSTAPELLRLRGIRPFEHRINPTAFVEVLAESDTVELVRDGEPLTTLTRDGNGNLIAQDLDLGGPGWHQLVLRPTGAADWERTIDYFIVQLFDVSWTETIEPVFQSFCAGPLCHGPDPEGNRVDLSTYDSWRARADRIRERMLRGEMPPQDPRPPIEDIDVVVQWIEGGMQP